MAGGLSKSKWVMKARAFEDVVFIEVVLYADWLLSMVCGGTRKTSNLSDSELWKHWVSQTQTQSDDGDNNGGGDLFARVALTKKRRKKNPSGSRAIGPQKVEVPWPDQPEKRPITIMALNSPTKTAPFTLWIAEDDLCDVVSALIEEKSPTVDHDGLATSHTVPTYDLTTRTWFVQWIDAATDQVTEVKEKVDNRRRNRTLNATSVVTPQELVRRKRLAKKRLKKRARELGCPALSDSDDAIADADSEAGADSGAEAAIAESGRRA